MAYCKILISNFWSSGTVSALSAALALPVTFSQSPERTGVYRSLSQTADQYLICDFGAAQTVNFLAIANLKLQNTGGSIELYQGGTGASPGAWVLVAEVEDYDLDTRVMSAIFGDTYARHWKIVFVNGDSGVADYVEAGYVGLGPAMAQARDCRPDVDFERIDPSTMQQSVDGQKSFTTRTGYYTGQLTFDFLLEADATLFHAAWRTVSKVIPFFFLLDTGITNQQWLMRFGDGLRIGRKGGAVPFYQVGFDWEEAR